LRLTRSFGYIDEIIANIALGTSDLKMKVNINVNFNISIPLKKRYYYYVQLSVFYGVSYIETKS